MPSELLDRVRDVLCDVLSPMVEHDGGKLYLVEMSDEGVKLHLAGTYGGCPGTPVAIEHVLLPPLQRVAPGLDVAITCGWRVPEGAERLAKASS
jgi:Fe-S cluster biogenesis protein NfuA